jgi:hypothetical protein
MTDKQAFGVIVRGFGLWFIAQAFFHAMMAATTVWENQATLGAPLYHWVITPIIYFGVGIFLLMRPEFVVELSYKVKNNRRD